MTERARDVLRLALLLGLLGGFVEVSALAVIKYAGLALPEGRLALGVVGQRHGYLWLSPQIVWMAPLAYATLLGGVAAAGLVLRRLAPGRVRRTHLTWALVFSVLTSLIWINPRLHALAGLVLAAGIAVQATRWLERRNEAVDRVARLGTPILATTTLALMVGLLAWEPLRERRMLRGLPEAAPGTPSVVLVILDTVRAANLSLYGYARPTTPNLEARSARGVVFDRAYATSPWTLPSHASVFTGRWPYEFSADWFVPYEGEFPTLAEVLAGQGLRTAGFVANTVYAAWESGLGRGFMRYEDYKITPGEFVISTGLGRKLAHTPWVRRLVGFYDVLDRKDAAELTDDFLSWHEGAGSRPYFAFLNYLDAHEPYLPPEPLADRFGSQEPRHPELHTYQIRRAIRLGRQEMPAAELQAELDAYDATIQYQDQQLERLFATLEARGALDNTIVVVTSDHGEHFGEHGLHLHGASLYDPVLHVPLVVWFGDRIPAGIRLRDPVSIRDIPATVASLVTGSADPFPGQALARYWAEQGDSEEELDPARQEPAREPRAVASEFTDIRGAPIVKAVTDDRFRYIWSERGEQELYDLVADPAETRNLVGEPDYQETLLRMRQLMAPHVRGDRVLWDRLPRS